MDEAPKPKEQNKNMTIMIVSAVVLLLLFAGDMLKGILGNIIQWIGIGATIIVAYFFIINMKPKPKTLTAYDQTYKAIYEEKRNEYLIEKAKVDAERDAKDTRNDIEKFIDKLSGK